MEKEEALRSLLQMSAAVAQMNSDFCAAAAAYMRRRRDILRALQRLRWRRRNRRRRRPAAERRFWVRPGRSTAWWDRFTSGAAAPEEWTENFRMSREALVQLSDRLRPHVQGETTKMRAPVDVLTKVACTLFYLSDEGRLRKTADAFGLSRSSVSVFIRQVCRAVSVFLGPDLIRTPSSQQEVEDLAGLRPGPRAAAVPRRRGLHARGGEAAGAAALGLHQRRRGALAQRARSLRLQGLLPGRGGEVARGRARRSHLRRVQAQRRAEGRDDPTVPQRAAAGRSARPGVSPRRRGVPAAAPPDEGVPGGRRDAGGAALQPIVRAAGADPDGAGAPEGALRRPAASHGHQHGRLPFVIHACFVLHNYCEASGEAVSERSLSAALRHERDAQPPASVSEETAEQDAEGQAVRRVLTKFLDT
ncbi:hypothetical protein PFLUV_G00161530 [Perca fluviatilis]|uniref:Nuclease HARBI1 n=1 Tax=Perca fluviatilis TaxID=8168 RepID=A0A6A5EIB8_PERFL|nr:uncharacterized protein LOC120570991 [Perca fluviatilis]KAF1382156.1 hypothetical protein PFLUV_G00161530 [Perca fluviatilis]